MNQVIWAKIWSNERKEREITFNKKRLGIDEESVKKLTKLIFLQTTSSSRFTSKPLKQRIPFANGVKNRMDVSTGTSNPSTGHDTLL